MRGAPGTLKREAQQRFYLIRLWLLRGRHRSFTVFPAAGFRTPSFLFLLSFSEMKGQTEFVSLVRIRFDIFLRGLTRETALIRRDDDKYT